MKEYFLLCIQKCVIFLFEYFGMYIQYIWFTYNKPCEGSYKKKYMEIAFSLFIYSSKIFNFDLRVDIKMVNNTENIIYYKDNTKNFDNS